MMGNVSSSVVRLAAALIGFFGFLSPLPATATSKVWAESPLATVQSGIREDGRKTREQLVTIGVIAPSTLFHPYFKHCSEQALASLAVQLRIDLQRARGLDTIVNDLGEAGTSVTEAAITLQKADRTAQISKVVDHAIDRLRAGMITCLGNDAVEMNPQISLAFSFRECSDDVSICNWVARSKITPPNFPEVFERLYSWATVSQPRALNEWIATSEHGPVVPADSAQWENSIVWPKPPPADVALADLERLIARSRERKSASISYVVPAIVGVHRETALRFIDQLAQPFTAMQLLPAGSDTLKLISDELGRSRIVDCARLSGKFGVDSIGQCAGFILNETEVYGCISGQHCLPVLRDTASAALLTLRQPMDLQKLLSDTQLPRVGISIPYPDWVKKAQSCQAKETVSASTDCLMKETMAAEDYAMVECTKGAQGPKKNEMLLQCAENLATGPAKAMVGCIRAGAGDPSSTAYCAIEGSIPAQFKPAIQCITSPTARADAATCIGRTVLGPRGEQFLDCYQSNRNSPQAAVVCAVGKELPKDAQLVWSCAQTGGGTWQGMATCIATQKLALTGEVGRIVACGLSSGGTVVGTAACAAGSNLRPEQAIVLQCAATASTGPGFLVCTGGLLTFNEYIKCRKSRIGKDNCFGENNEIRRFVRALGLPDIGPNSLAAQVGNVYLDIINIQVAYLEGVAKGGKVVVREVVRVFVQAGKVAKDAVNDGIRAGKKVIRCLRTLKC